jgi:hypothetical protein
MMMELVEIVIWYHPNHSCMTSGTIYPIRIFDEIGVQKIILSN